MRALDMICLLVPTTLAVASAVCMYKHYDDEWKFVKRKVSLEVVGWVLFAMFIVSIFGTAYVSSDKCANCNAMINTAFCTQCGNRNNNYVEPVEKNETGLMCPTCEVECVTPFCGKCGSQIVVVDID